MWSIYDTLMLITGIIVLVIAVVPVAGVPASTRLWSGAIGGGLTLLSLYLGSLRSFTYPSLVMGGPLIALLALGAVVVDARKRSNPDQAGLPFDQQASGPRPPEPTPLAARPDAGVAAPGSGPVAAEPVPALPEPSPLAGPTPVPEPADVPVDPAVQAVTARLMARVEADRNAAWAEVNLATTSAARLAEIAGTYPEFAPQMLSHPSLYPELAEWIRSLPGTAVPD